MSGIDPQKMAVYRELVRRKAELSPEKQAILGELGQRFAAEAGGDPTGKGVDAARIGEDKTATPLTGAGPNFITNMLGTMNTAMSPIHSPIETLKSLPGVAATTAAGIAVGKYPDILGIKPVAEQAMRGDISGAVGSAAGTAASAALIGRGMGAAKGGTTAALKTAGKTSLPETLAQRAGANRQLAATTGPFRGGFLDDLVATQLGSILGEATGMGWQKGMALVEGLNLARQFPKYRQAKASLQEFLSQQMAKSRTAPTSTLPPTPPEFNVPTPAVPPLRAVGSDPVQGIAGGRIQGQHGGRSTPTPAPLNRPPIDVPERVVPSTPTQVQRPSLPPEARDILEGRVQVTPPVTAPALNKWMNVTPKQMVHGANPAEQILKDGLLGPTKEATLSNVQTRLTKIEARMDSILEIAGKKGTRVNGEPLVMEALESATKTIGKRSDTAFQNALTGVLDDILAEYPDLSSLTPQRLHSLTRDIGDAITWGKGVAYEGDLNQALLGIYKKTSPAVKEAAPGIALFQKQWGNLYQGVKALRKSIDRDKAGVGSGEVFKPKAK